VNPGGLKLEGVLPDIKPDNLSAISDDVTAVVVVVVVVIVRLSAAVIRVTSGRKFSEYSTRVSRRTSVGSQLESFSTTFSTLCSTTAALNAGDFFFLTTLVSTSSRVFNVRLIEVSISKTMSSVVTWLLLLALRGGGGDVDNVRHLDNSSSLKNPS
jgi:hypothetical protein